MGICDSDAVGCNRHKLWTPSARVHANRRVLVQSDVLISTVRRTTGCRTHRHIVQLRAACRGSECRYVDEQSAQSAIAGYCVCNDVSERAFQLERGGQWDKGKGCDSFGPIGPWLVTADEITDTSDLTMWLDVNGRRFQSGSTRTMIFRPAFLVRYLSQFMSLQPGDIISTGTPPGVGLGQKPPIYLNVGDTITLSIAGLGTQRQVVVDSQIT